MKVQKENSNNTKASTYILKYRMSRLTQEFEKLNSMIKELRR